MPKYFLGFSVEARQAVLELRQLLKLDQRQFAEKIGVGYSTLRTYETHQPIKDSAVLVRLIRLAEESGGCRMAEPFRKQLRWALGPEVLAAIAGTPDNKGDQPPSVVPLVENFARNLTTKGYEGHPITFTASEVEALLTACKVAEQQIKALASQVAQAATRGAVQDEAGTEDAPEESDAERAAREAVEAARVAREATKRAIEDAGAGAPTPGRHHEHPGGTPGGKP